MFCFYFILFYFKCLCCGNAWKPIYFSKKDDSTTQPTTEYKKDLTTSSTTESQKGYQSPHQSHHVNQNIKPATSTTTTRKLTNTATSAILKYTEELTNADDLTELSQPSYSNKVEETNTMATTIVIYEPTEETVLTNASFEEILPSYTFHGTDSSQEEQEIVFPIYGHYGYSDNYYYYNLYDEFEEPLKTSQIESKESLNNFEKYGKKTTKTSSTVVASTVKVQRL